MAQSVSSSSSNRNIGRDDSSDENSRPFGAHGDSGGNVYTGYSPDRTNGMPTISSTSTTSSALVTTGVRRGNLPGELTPRSGASGVICSEPAYSPSAQTPSHRELQLRASAVEIRDAMEAEQPLAALQKIFSQHDAVRLELPEMFADAFGKAAYNTFSTEGWLAKLRVRHLDLTIEPNVRKEGRCFEEHRFFLGKVIEACNALAGNGNTGLTLGIDVPLPRLTADYSATDALFRGTTALGFKHLFEALQADTVTVRLGLSGIRSEWFPLDLLSGYFDSLATNSKLETLDLSHANLSDDDACALAGALNKNRSIKSIDLRECITSDKGGKVLFAALLKRREVEVTI